MKSGRVPRVLLLLCVTVALAVLAALMSGGPSRIDGAEPLDLRDASLDEVAQYALAVTRYHYRVMSGTLAASVVRRTDAAELESFGMGSFHLYCGEPPIVLTIVSGDLELQYVTMRPAGAPSIRTDLVAHVFIESNGKEVGEIWGHSQVEPLLRAANAAPPHLESGTPRIPAALPAGCTQGGFAPTIVIPSAAT